MGNDVAGANSVFLLKQVGRQSIWGRRGLLKANTLWLPLAIHLAEDSKASSLSFRSLELIFAAVICWIFTSILANDFGECRQDRSAGKSRWICRIPAGAAQAIIIIFAGAGLAVVFRFARASEPKWIFLGAVLLGLGYSLRPTRLKERGIGGLFGYSLACAFAYAALPLTWLKSGIVVFSVSTVAVFLDKWVNLHFHQVIDYPTDLAIDTKTYAVRAGSQRAQRSLRRFAVLATLALLAVVGYGLLIVTRQSLLAGLFSGAVGFSCVTVIFLARDLPGLANALTRVLPWFYLAMTLFAFRVFPLILVGRLAIKDGSFVPVFLIALVMLAAESWQSFRYRYE